MCQFIETIKFEGGTFYHLPYHQERVNRTCKNFFPEQKPFDLSSLLESQLNPGKGLYRCRIIYGSEIKSIEFIKQEKREIKTLQVVCYNDIEYSYKFYDRELIQELTKQKADSDDILIIKNGQVSDTSIGNILFFDGQQWITPDSPLLPGTTRARLLKEGIVTEKEITLKGISKFKGFQVINALKTFQPDSFNPIANIHR